MKYLNYSVFTANLNSSDFDKINTLQIFWRYILHQVNRDDQLYVEFSLHNKMLQECKC